MQMLFVFLGSMLSLIVAFALPNLAPTDTGATAAAESGPIGNCIAGQTTIISHIITATFSEANDAYANDGYIAPPSMMVRVQRQCKHEGSTHQILVSAIGSVASKHCKKGGYIWATGTLTLWAPMPGATGIPLLKANGIRCGDSWEDVR